MKKLCIFDLDGTLTDTLTAIAHFANLALKEMGFDPIEKENFKYFAGDGRSMLMHRTLNYHNADTDENFKKIVSLYDTAYEADPMYKTDAYDGIRDVVDALKEKGIKIAVCSNKPHNVACDVIKTVFGDKFDYVKGINDGDKVKPYPDNVFKIMNEFNVKKEDCIFVGDTNVDIQTAKNAGVESIGVLWGFRDREELIKAGADHIIRKPCEILKFI